MMKKIQSTVIQRIKDKRKKQLIIRYAKAYYEIKDFIYKILNKYLKTYIHIPHYFGKKVKQKHNDLIKFIFGTNEKNINDLDYQLRKEFVKQVKRILNKYQLQRIFSKTIWFNSERFQKIVSKLDNDFRLLFEIMREDLKYLFTNFIPNVERKYGISFSQLHVYEIINSWCQTVLSILHNYVRMRIDSFSLPVPNKHTVSFAFDGCNYRVLDNCIQINLSGKWLSFSKPSFVFDSKQCRIKVWFMINEVELYTTYQTPIQTFSNQNQENWLSIDLGVNNFLSMVSNVKNLPSLILSGGWLHSLLNWATRRLSEHQSKNQMKKYHKLQRYLKHRIVTNFHEIAKQIIDLCIAYGIKTIYIGENVIDSLRFAKQERKLNQDMRRLLHKIPFSKFIQILQHKAQIHNIEVKLVDESFTSKLSCFSDPIFKDNKKNKQYLESLTQKNIRKGSKFIDVKLRKHFHADLNACLNIVRKAGCLVNLQWNSYWKKKVCNGLRFSFNKFINFCRTIVQVTLKGSLLPILG